MKVELNKLTNLLVGAFALIVIVDPPNTLLHLKDPIFITLFIFVAISFVPTLKLFIPFLLAVIVWLVSSCIGYASLSIVDFEFNVGIFKSFMPLLLIGWIKYLNFRDKLLIPCILISIISIVVLLAMLYFKEFEAVLYGYFTKDNGLMMISRRSFIGLEFVSAFYRTTPVIIIPLSVISYNIILKNRSNKNFLQFVILSLGLFSGGNRACMLSAIGIPTTIYLYKLYINKELHKFIFLCIFMSLVFVCILWMLLTDTEETSNIIKYGHITSYIQYFNDNIEYVLFGSGAGSLFYSKGFGTLSVQTEWTYIELVRYFGIIGAIVILGIFTYPVFKFIRLMRTKSEYLPIIVGYVYYLCLAGTNPLLLSSTGMIICLYMYSCAYYKQIK